LTILTPVEGTTPGRQHGALTVSVGKLAQCHTHGHTSSPRLWQCEAVGSSLGSHSLGHGLLEAHGFRGAKALQQGLEVLVGGAIEWPRAAERVVDRASRIEGQARHPARRNGRCRRMRALVTQEMRQDVRMWPFWRLLVASWNALVDLETRKPADEDPVRTEPGHGWRKRVVRREERVTDAGAELGERFGICSAHADIDLLGTKAEVKQDGAAIIRPQRLVVWAALGHHRTAVHSGARRGETQRQYVAPAIGGVCWRLV